MQFVIPTIYTARDDMSPVVLRMQRNMDGLNASAGRQRNTFQSLTSQMLSYAGVAGTLGAISGAMIFSGRSLMDYERELANLRALTGVTGEEFLQFKNIIQEVAKEQKMSSVTTAQAFTIVANAMPELLGSAVGLGMVTNESILLAKAARMELAPAAEAVTTILNQYGKGAEEAARLVDLMAAGSKYGSAEITDLSLSMKEFAAQARLANVSMNESVALAELVSKFRKGTQAGIELRNVLLYLDTLKGQDPKALKDLQRLGVNMNLVADKGRPLKDRLTELSKIGKDAAAIFHVFGKENSAMAATVLQNVDKLQPLITKLGETGVAQAMAAENTNTLYFKVQQLTGRWVQYITASDGAGVAMSMVGGMLDFVTNNMGTLLDIAVPALTLWASYKTLMWGVRGVTLLYNIATGIAAGMTSNLSIALMENAAAAKAETFILRARINVMWQMVAASTALKIAIGGVVFGALMGYVSSMGLATEKSDMFADRMDILEGKFKSIRAPIDEATVAMKLYNNAVEEYNKYQEKKALHDYNMKHHPVKTVINELFSMDKWFTKPGGDTMAKPQMQDYFTNLSDTANIQKEYVQGYLPEYGNESPAKSYGKNPTQNLKITIDNKTNNPIGVDDKGTSIPVNIKQTGTYSR